MINLTEGNMVKQVIVVGLALAIGTWLWAIDRLGASYGRSQNGNTGEE